MLTVSTGYQTAANGALTCESSFASNSAANPYPSSYALAPCNSSGVNMSQYTSPQKTLCAPPPNAAMYIQTTWVAAMSAAFQQSAWRLSHLNQNSGCCDIVEVSPSYYIFYGCLITLFRRSTLVIRSPPLPSLLLQPQSPTSNCYPSPSPSNLPRFASSEHLDLSSNVDPASCLLER